MATSLTFKFTCNSNDQTQVPAAKRATLKYKEVAAMFNYIVLSLSVYHPHSWSRRHRANMVAAILCQSCFCVEYTRSC